MTDLLIIAFCFAPAFLVGLVAWIVVYFAFGKEPDTEDEWGL